MSLVTLQIGQCGNQVGEAYYNQIIQEMYEGSPGSQACGSNIFFHQSESSAFTANSILLDMEPKVVNNCIQSKKQGWNYNPKNVYSKQEGSGNNWAFGYNIHGPSCKEEVLNRIRNLIEKLDIVSGFFLIQSLAGGTGSGFGSYLLNLLQEEYSELPILSFAVLPHLSGEVILQSYNSMLSLSHLYQDCDGIALIENDKITNMCTELLQLKKPSITDMNKIIAQQFVSVFFPVIDPSGPKKIFSPLDNKFDYFMDLNQVLLCDPYYKMLDFRYVPFMPEKSKEFTLDTWAGLEKRILQMLIGNSTEANINWYMKPESGFVNNVDKILDNAVKMYHSNSYLHHYHKYGLEKDDIAESLLYIEQVLFNYKKL